MRFWVDEIVKIVYIAVTVGIEFEPSFGVIRKTRFRAKDLMEI